MTSDKTGHGTLTVTNVRDKSNKLAMETANDFLSRLRIEQVEMLEMTASITRQY